MMSEKIESPLNWPIDEHSGVWLAIDGGSASELITVRVLRQNAEWLPALIALANAALPDDDPRKITRAMIEEIRDAASEFETTARQNPTYVTLNRIADALESYLPPVA